MKQPTFDWNSIDKYAELRNLKLEVHMFQTYSISQEESMSIIIIWLGRQAYNY